MRITKLFLILCLTAGIGLNAQSVDPAPPTPAAITAKLAAMTSAHPRLFGVADNFAQLKKNAATPVGRSIARRVVADADLMLELPLQERRFDAANRRILMVSREALNRILTLSMAYHLTGQEKYADCAIKNLLNVCAFTDWNPKHFLDVAEMTLAAAIGYDWLYQRLSQEQRDTVAYAIVSKGLKADNFSYIGGWKNGGGNWSAVCYCGLIAGALAVYENDPALAANIIRTAVTYLPTYFKEAYGTNGAYEEGPIYWQYGTDFAVMALALLGSTLQDDFGLADRYPGFRRTGDFIIHAYGPTGLPFSYGDAAVNSSPEPGQTYFPALLAKTWLSNHFQRPDWYFTVEQDQEIKIGETIPEINKRADDPQKWTIKPWRERIFPLTLLFLPSQKTPEQQQFAPLSYFSGNGKKFAVSMHRSDWTQQALYVGIKAGSPSAGHGHMDTGSFVLDVNGIRWAEDLGMVDYAAYESRNLGLWNNKQNGFRWQIFRCGPESHNLLRIDRKLQTVGNTAPITTYEDTPGNQTSTINLTPVYEGQAQEVTRTFRLLPEKQLLITDRLTGLKPGAEVRWQMCTRATVEKIAGMTIKLNRAEQTLSLAARSNTTGRWSAVNCAPFLRPFDPQADKTCTMLYYDVFAPADGKVEITVRISPGNSTAIPHN